MAERPTFSPFWHRVRAMKPRLRPHVQITRQHYRAKRWHVVHDPSSNQFYRLNPIAHEFVGLLDGHRTVEEVWEISLQRHGDAAPTQQEALQLIGQLYGANLLSVDATPETEQLLKRGRERLKKKAMGQAIGIMYFKIRLFNPDRIVAWVEPILRPVLNKWGFLLWAAFLVFVVARLLPNASALADQVENTLAPANWPWLMVVFVLTKALHELGHGVILKRHGGQVPELGVMLLVLFPAPYVDASSAWALPDKWKRVAVGAGGMLFELFVAGVAALVWLETMAASDSLIHQLAYNAMFIASVSTILFNANPLMRFDGYYILSDLLEMPNLMQRSMNQIKFLFKRYPYGMTNERPPTAAGNERAVLMVYGVSAIAYRIFLFFSITLLVMGKLFAVGLILAIWTASMWFILPVGKFVHWLASSPALHDKRPRAVGASIAMIAAGLLLVGAVPFPDNRRAAGVVESRQRSGVFYGAAGFVAAAHARPGGRLAAGDPIVTLENPELHARIRRGRAELARLESVERQAMREQPIAVDVLAAQLASVREQLDFLEERAGRLVVRAPHDGVLVGRDPHHLIGSYVNEGELAGEIVEPDSLRVVASLGQRENAWAAAGDDYRVQIRMVSRASRALDGEVERVVPAGQSRLPHGALGYAGGGAIQTEATDQSGTLARSGQFLVEIRPTPDAADGELVWAGAPGERVRLRFTLDSKPLLEQWVDRLSKLVQSRVKL